METLKEKLPVFSARFFWPPEDFDISTRSYLTSSRDSRRGFGRLDFETSLRSYLKSCRDSRRVFGHRDFEILPRSPQSRRPKTRRDSRRDLDQNFAGVGTLSHIMYKKLKVGTHDHKSNLAP